MLFCAYKNVLRVQKKTTRIASRASCSYEVWLLASLIDWLALHLKFGSDYF